MTFLNKKIKMKRLPIIITTIIVFSISAFLISTPRLYTVPILTYHHIDDEEHRESPAVSIENFSWQMEFIQEREYNVISLAELVVGIKTNKRFPFKTVVITFDDGYKNFYTNAFPVLKKYNFPVTIFIGSKTVGKQFMTWGEIYEIRDWGADFGSHGVLQAYLPIENEIVLHKEIFLSKETLESKLEKEIRYFCYPLGGFNNRIKHLVKLAGYRGACTTNRGSNRFNRDVYSLQRIKPTNKDTSATFWMKLSGLYNLFRSQREPY